MTISHMRASMTPREFSSWVEFYKLFPFDDRHRFHRPAAMVAASMGGKYDERIEFLSPEPKPSGLSKADIALMKAFGMKPRTLKKEH
jgi:hypothetical protein